MAATFSIAMMHHLRRRLQANTTISAGSTNSSISTAGSSSSLTSTDAETEDDASGYTPEQLMTLAVSGWLAVTLYTLLAIAIVWMTVLHFRHDSSPRKRIFHLLLLTSVLFNLPDPLGWLLWPNTESWVYTYPLRIYSLLLQSVCKSIISLAWSEVVAAGQSYERRRVSYLVMGFNAVLALWGVSVPFLLAKYPNDVYGQYDFMQSKLRAIVSYSGVGVIFVYGLLLTFQGIRLRRRLMQAKGTVPIGSVEKSLSQLMLTLYVIVFSDLMRIGSLALNEANVDMPMTTFLVCNNLVPNIFPDICMLYLMRRYAKKEANASASDPVHKPNGVPRRPTRGADTTLSRYMTDDRESDLNDAPVLGMSKFTLPASRIASIDRVELDGHNYHQSHQPHAHTQTDTVPHELVDSRGSHRSTLTPVSHWVRK